jgi:UDP-glucose 4-epimerase
MVIGGKGFIGSSVIHQLTDAGHAVVCVEPKTTPGRLSDLIDRIELVEGDIANDESIKKVMSQHPVDAITALPFYRGPSIRDELEVMAAGTWRVFESARQAGVRRVVFPSSIRVYGPQSLHGEVMVNENSPCLALDKYGVYKHLGEVVGSSYNAKYSMEIAALRISGVYGPGVREGSAGVSAAPYLAATSGQVVLPFLPNARLCLAHVDDIAAALIALILADRPRFSVYEAGGHAVSYSEMAEITKLLVPDCEIRFVPTEEHPELTYTYLTDNSRLREEFGIVHRSVLEGYRTIVDDVRAKSAPRPG